MPENSNRDETIFHGILDVIKTQWHLGFTAFGGPPVHFQIVGPNPYPKKLNTNESFSPYTTQTVP